MNKITKMVERYRKIPDDEREFITFSLGTMIIVLTMMGLLILGFIHGWGV